MMLQFTNSFVEVSALGDLETELTKLYRNMALQSLAPYDTATALGISEANSKKDYNLTSISLDNGNGRISAGLKSLELLAILCSGTAPQNLFLFDNVIYSGSFSEFKNGSDQNLISLVIANLGMSEIVAAFAEASISEYKTQCLKIGKLVRSGQYTADMYAGVTRRDSKRLAKKYLEIV